MDAKEGRGDQLERRADESAARFSPFIKRIKDNPVDQNSEADKPAEALHDSAPIHHRRRRDDILVEDEAIEKEKDGGDAEY